MRLLTEQELIWSDVVANNRMNRKRKASGVNSYEKELRFKPETFLNSLLQQKGQVKWLDLCCGEGNALLQYARELYGKGFQEQATLKGIDLVDQFQPIPEFVSCVQFEVRSLIDWTAGDQYDLVTCVHGLHYAGDKIRVIQAALQAVADNGLLLANLDLNSIKVEGDPLHKQLKGLFKANNIDYNGRLKLLVCKGPRNIPVHLTYLGANDQAGPNYTGQDAVDSYYAVGL
ncbi:MAG: methyltransferase domain-containing protein [Niastella sp.]|nr:methyltransferase domain-containing protein [Niastella sp.]